MDNLRLWHTMFANKKNNFKNHENEENLSDDKIKQIEEKHVYSFKYTGQHGDIIT